MRDNAQLVIVRLSTEDNKGQRAIAAQQVSALADAGIPWQGYLWCYWGMDPVDHWALAQEMLPASWPGYYGLNIWLDMEDDCSPPLLALAWVYAYGELLRRDGFAPGVYTGEWWIDKHDAAFKPHLAHIWNQYPLWFAAYKLPRPPADKQTAPWGEVAIHQYASVDVGDVLRSYDVSDVYNVQ